MSEHVVTPVAPCRWEGLRNFTPCVNTTLCDGCLRDGRRALLDQAVPVEKGPRFARVQSWWEQEPSDDEVES